MASCRIYGTYLPFDALTLDALYPNHEMYVRLVSRVTSENRLKGFLVKEDAEATIRDAIQSGVGKRKPTPFRGNQH